MRGEDKSLEEVIIQVLFLGIGKDREERKQRGWILTANSHKQICNVVSERFNESVVTA